MRQYWPYPYVSHLLLLSPEAAEVRFDLLCFRFAGDGRGSGPTGLGVVPVRSGRLELGPPDPAVEWRRGYRPCRALPGTLHPAGWRAHGITVDLELLPWSATRSELALIAGATRRPDLVGERRYLRLAHDILSTLVDALEAAGDDHDDDLDRTKRPPKTGAAPGWTSQAWPSSSPQIVPTGGERAGAQPGGGRERGR